MVTFYFTEWAIGLRQGTEREFKSGFTLQIFMMRYYDELLIRLQPCGCSKVRWKAQTLLLTTIYGCNLNSKGKQYNCNALFQFQSSDWLVLCTSFFPWIKGIPSFHILPWFLSGDDGRAQWCYQAKLHHVLNSFPSGFSTNN